MVLNWSMIFILNKQLNSVINTSFYHLRLLSTIKSALSFKRFECLIHAFITMCLDYCNVHCVGLSKVSLFCLQLVQNARICLLTGTRHCKNITHPGLPPCSLKFAEVHRPAAPGSPNNRTENQGQLSFFTPPCPWYYSF